MRARLIPIDGGPPIELTKELTLAGRGDDCDICIDHKSISKRHCVLVKTDGLIVLRDLGSTNGTRVNGQRVRRASLLPNDHVAFANFRYIVKFGEGAVNVPVESQQPVEVSNADSSAEIGVPPNPAALRVNDLPDTYPASVPQKKKNN